MNAPIILDSKFKKIDFIYHISDIHIRKRERHAEYLEIFNRTVQNFNKNNSCVVVTGDIMHDKSELVPESIDLLKKFLIELTDKLEVILIIGNHDINIFNKKAMDCITPILKNLETVNKIHLLNESKIYSYCNIYFGLTRMFDKKVMNFDKYDMDKNKVKIGLYHGMIHGCSLDNDITYTNNSYFNCKDFNHYDIVMLGDIHKHQFLKKNMAYAGSLIQQKRDEHILNHGYIQWNMKTLNGKFFRVKNDFGMLEVNAIDDFKFDDFDFNIDELPSKIDLKIIYDQKKNFDKIFDLFENNGKKIIKCSEVISNKIVKSDVKVNNQKINSNESVIKVMIEHIKDNNKDNNINDNLNLIKNKIKEILDEINYDFDQESKKIKLKSIKFNNMFIYLDNNIINFQKFKKIVGLNAQNYQGKSSFIDIILYSIYGKCSRGKRFDVLNINKKKMNSEIKLTCNQDNIKIIRNSIISSESKRDLKETVEVYLNNNLVTGDDRLKTNHIIEKLLCKYEDMLNNSFVLQKNGKSFIELDDRSKKDLLCKMAKLDIFDKIFQLAKSKHYSIGQSIGKIVRKLEHFNKYVNINISARNTEKYISKINEYFSQQKYKYYDIKKLENKLNFNSELLEKYEIDKIRYDNGLKNNLSNVLLFTKNYSYLYQKYGKVKINTRHIEKKRKEINNKIKNTAFNVIPIEFDIDELNEKLLTEQERLIQLNDTKNELMNKIINSKKYIMRNINVEIDYERYIKTLKDNEKKMERIEDIKTRIEDLEKNIDHDYEYDPKCEYCMKNNFTQTKIKFERNIKENKNILEKIKLNDLDDKIRERYEIYEKERNNLEEYEKKFEQIEKYIDKINIDEIKKNICILENNKRINLEIETFNLELKKLDDEMKEIEKDKKITLDFVLEKNDFDFKRYYSLKINAINSNSNINVKEIKDKIKIRKEHNEIEKKKQIMMEYEKRDFERLVNELREYESDKLVLSYIKKILDKNGLVDIILKKNIIGTLVNNINGILGKIFHYKIKMEYKNQSINIFKDNGLNIIMSSGYESYILDLVFRLSMVQINNHIKTNFMIIDEGFNACDQDHKNNVKDLLEYMTNHYDWILIISHDEFIKSFYDMNIRIKKKIDNVDKKIKGSKLYLK